MAIFPCDQKGLCLDPANPFQNFSAEAPDQKTFIGFNTGFGPTDFYPPLGSDFFQVGCRSFCVSTVSQQDADQCAARTNVECLSSVWPTATPGIDIFGNPVPIYRQRQVFLNHAQSVTILCPDGQPFTYTVPAGRYAAFSQEDADQAALSDAAEHAPLFIVCISDLTVTQTCPDEPYAASITASGMTLTDANVCWDLIGTLPPGITTDIQDVGNCLTGSRTLNFHGTPTTPGVYTFSIRASDDRGDFMVKPFTISVEGIADVNPLPDATTNTAYSQTLTAIGVTNPVYSLEDGSTLPSGLSLDSTGVIFGTPTVSGDFNFVLGVTEAGTGRTCSVDASVTVKPGTCSAFTGVSVASILPSDTKSPSWTAYSPEADLIFGGGTGDSRIDIINPLNNTLLTSINLPGLTPRVGVYHPSNGYIYVGCSQAVPGTIIKVVNPLTLSVIATINAPNGDVPTQLAPDTINQRLYINYNQPGTQSLESLDINTNTITSIALGGATGSGVAYCPTNNLIFTFIDTNLVSIFDAATFSLVGILSTQSPNSFDYCSLDDCVYYNDVTANDVVILSMASTLNRVTAANFVIPPVGNTVPVSFNSAEGMIEGRNIVVSGKNYTIVSVDNSTDCTLRNLDGVPATLVLAGAAAQTTGIGTSSSLPGIGSFGIQFLSKYQHVFVASFDGGAGTTLSLIDPNTHLVDATFPYPADIIFWVNLSAANNCGVFFPEVTPANQYVVKR